MYSGAYETREVDFDTATSDPDFETVAHVADI